MRGFAVCGRRALLAFLRFLVHNFGFLQKKKTAPNKSASTEGPRDESLASVEIVGRFHNTLVKVNATTSDQRPTTSLGEFSSVRVDSGAISAPLQPPLVARRSD